MWKNMYVIGSSGSEGGTILYDEEYKASCRITLEQCSRYYAITCGVYGAMVHTVFCNSKNYDDTYSQMKSDLQAFIDKSTTEDEEMEFYEYFTNKY